MTKSIDSRKVELQILSHCFDELLSILSEVEGFLRVHHSVSQLCYPLRSVWCNPMQLVTNCVPMDQREDYVSLVYKLSGEGI